MPFLADIDTDDEVLQRPIWGVFALLKDNLERLIAVNIGWALQLLPAIAAFGFTTLPLVVRVLLVLYSATALAPATAILFTLIARVCHGEALRLSMLKEDIQTLTLPGFLRFAPLFGLLGVCFWLTILVAFVHVLFLDILIRFVLLGLLLCSLYWGPLFAEYPQEAPWSLLRRSFSLIWHYPGATVLTGSIVLLAMFIGAISIGGLVLIVPVVVALLQTRRCHELLVRQHSRRKNKTLLT
jgi:hypothetical protein